MSTQTTHKKFYSVEPLRSRLLTALWQHQMQDGYISKEAIQLLATEQLLPFIISFISNQQASIRSISTIVYFLS